MGLKIENRRYIGSKRKLVEEIYAISQKYFGNKKISFSDVFAGTGIVAKYFFDRGHDVIVNDLLKSNFIAYSAWISNEDYDYKKIEKLLEKFNSFDASILKPNYFSDTYGDKYFSVNDAKKIGYIRDKIEEMKNSLTFREYCILLSSLMYTTDKIANTVGHFEHFLSQKPVYKNFTLDKLDLSEPSWNKALIFNEDSNKLVKKIESDVIYIDPPYNARQYVNFYHVLENLVNWDKPNEFEGSSMKFKRNHLKSEYSRSKAVYFFEELINNIKAKLIIVSYNNTYNAKSSASNNKIKESEMINILKKKGKLTVKEFEHPFFNSGTTNFNNHLEKIYICEVN
ncbi:DNA adenine methylase [Spiroplasma alleghenense]|uniref:site-specific DNA-methyltransferase (adenine-specific) n=1 Tax=Spiroplasma alleghenense TaxID=216931 RepID=A0A345Z4T8_9MOLU|nr:DNA adenine methylase [Spiroplasma alleghenense]AXK51617.1 adenine-specific DNA-methyltransferase [Spiroplasma alleghenense]